MHPLLGWWLNARVKAPLRQATRRVAGPARRVPRAVWVAVALVAGFLAAVWVVWAAVWYIVWVGLRVMGHRAPF